MIFHEYTISAFGHRADEKKYDSTKLGREAVDWLTALLERNGNEFRREILLKGVRNLELHWLSENLSCTTASLYIGGELLSTSVLVCGLSPAADERALSQQQARLLRACTAVGKSAGMDLLLLPERPAIATIPWLPQPGKGMDLITDMRICLAAAFFERSFRNRELGL